MSSPNDDKTLANLDWLSEESLAMGRKRAERYPDQKWFGYFCSYWPEELVLATGMEPLRLFPESGSATVPELPAYCCSLAHGTLLLAKRNSYQDLMGIGFAHTCDTMQCLSGIWLDLPSGLPVITMVPPVFLSAPGAFQYYRAQMAAAWAKLCELNDFAPTKDDLSQALQLCTNIRRLAYQLDELRCLLPSPLVSSILRAGQLMPRSIYAKKLQAILPILKEMASEPNDRQRIFLSGAVVENDSLPQLIEDLSGRVVADDTCTGFRHYLDVPSHDDDPLDAITRRYLNMPTCPSRHRSLNDRLDYLAELAITRQATGAILVVRKYCEPHAWDSRALAERLRSSGIKTLLLELDGADVGGQARTRVQAFMESLQFN